MESNWSRRSFLGAAALAVHAQPLRREVRVAILGTGSRGTELLRISLKQPGVRITAVCDILEDRATRAQQMVQDAAGQRPVPFTRGPEDYKRMIDTSDAEVV